MFPEAKPVMIIKCLLSKINGRTEFPRFGQTARDRSGSRASSLAKPRREGERRENNTQVWVSCF